MVVRLMVSFIPWDQIRKNHQNNTSKVINWKLLAPEKLGFLEYYAYLPNVVISQPISS